MTCLGHPSYDAHQLGQAQDWASAGDEPLSVQCDEIAAAEAAGDLIVPCPHRYHLPCGRCHGAGYLTLAQATPSEIAAAKAAESEAA